MADITLAQVEPNKNNNGQTTASSPPNHPKDSQQAQHQHHQQQQSQNPSSTVNQIQNPTDSPVTPSSQPQHIHQHEQQPQSQQQQQQQQQQHQPQQTQLPPQPSSPSRFSTSSGASSHFDGPPAKENLQIHQRHGLSPSNSPYSHRTNVEGAASAGQIPYPYPGGQPSAMHLPSAPSGIGSLSRGLPPIMSSLNVGPDGHHEPQRPISPRSLMAESNLDGSLGGSGGTTAGGIMDPAPRKRSKVSRACDECRRKKIRCDATSENGMDQCSSCKRAGSRCSFSRVPMKRGPSKGYIKELADRLNTLENSISTGEMHSYGPVVPMEGDMSPIPSESTSPPPISGAGPPPNKSRKRTLSSSGEFGGVNMHPGVHLQPLGQPAAHQRGERLPPIDSFHSHHGQVAPPQRQLPPPHPGPSPHQARPHTPVSVSSGPDVPSSYRSTQSPSMGNANPYWKSDVPDYGRQASVNMPLDPADVPPQGSKTMAIDTPFEWDEASIDQYYEIIHPTFPFLPHSKARLRSRLGYCPAKVRDAVLHALYCAVRSNPSSILPSIHMSDSRLAVELISSSQYEDAERSMRTNLLYLQAMIFQVLESDNYGPATMKGHMGPPRSVWLGAAVGLAYSLKLHQCVAHKQFADGDIDSDEQLGRRAWWVLVVLDKWHAISTSSPPLIPDSSIVLLPEDQVLLGVAPFHITRLSIILGHLAETLTTGSEVISAAPSNFYVSKLLRGELERFRESVDSVWGSLNLLHLAYWHVKLLTLRHNASSEPSHLIGPAYRIVSILDSSQTPITPLNHHFAALAVLTLVELTDIEETREEAWKGIYLLRDALQKRHGISTRPDSKGWDRTIKDIIERQIESRARGEKTAGSSHGSLQHLAELAVGRSPKAPHNNVATQSQGAAATSLESVKLLNRHGYLGCLV